MRTAFDKTAIKRGSKSRGLRIASELGYLQTIDGDDAAILDYGCGRGDDVQSLRDDGFDATGYDPTLPRDSVFGCSFTPPAGLGCYDTVLLTYVLNVIEHPDARAKVLREAFEYVTLGGVLVVTVRTDDPGDLTKWQPVGDGYRTTKGTFQTFYPNLELKRFVKAILGTEGVVHTHDKGTVVVSRDVVAS